MYKACSSFVSPYGALFSLAHFNRVQCFSQSSQVTCRLTPRASLSPRSAAGRPKDNHSTEATSGPPNGHQQQRFQMYLTSRNTLYLSATSITQGGLSVQPSSKRILARYNPSLSSISAPQAALLRNFLLTWHKTLRSPSPLQHFKVTPTNSTCEIVSTNDKSLLI